MDEREKENVRGWTRRHTPETEACSVPGCYEPAERHHPDYSDPLNVVWLCRKHHRQLHREKRYGVKEATNKPSALKWWEKAYTTHDYNLDVLPEIEIDVSNLGGRKLN
jgi:hypothetical protein